MTLVCTRYTRIVYVKTRVKKSFLVNVPCECHAYEYNILDLQCPVLLIQLEARHQFLYTFCKNLQLLGHSLLPFYIVKLSSVKRVKENVQKVVART